MSVEQDYLEAKGDFQTIMDTRKYLLKVLSNLKYLTIKIGRKLQEL